MARRGELPYKIEPRNSGFPPSSGFIKKRNMLPVSSYLYQTCLMGSAISLKFYRRNDEIAKQAFTLIKNWEDRLTVNRANAGGAGRDASGAVKSEIAAINAAAGERAAAVSPEVFALLQTAQAASLYPQGCFNFAIGPIVKAWSVGFAAARRPSSAEIAALLPLTNPRAVQLDTGKRTAFLPQKGMALDLGAIAKGFIADEIRDFLRAKDTEAALINLGGNIYALGAPPKGGICGRASEAKSANNRQAGIARGEAAGGQGWAIGLQKPFGGREELLGRIHIENKSAVTSGIYERYFLTGDKGARLCGAEDAQMRAEAHAAAMAAVGETRGKTAGSGARDNAADAADSPHFYHHIFSPQTGYPLHNDLMSVTIISDKSIDGEIWSSLLYGFGLEKSLRLLRNAADGAAEWECAALPLPQGLEAIFITKDRRIIMPSAKSFHFELWDRDFHIAESV